MSILATNKKIFHDYEILDKYEAGIVLSGQEVKSVRNGQMSLKGAYVTIDKNQEIYLTNATIPPYKMAGPLPNYDMTRSRKLLLNKKEIANLSGKTQQSGLTIVPISVYTKGKRIKIEIGLAKGKKKYDKREDIKKRDQKRQDKQLLKRTLRN